jgi:hypothetical protein
MGKTFRRDQQFRPRKHGRIFTKEDESWKKNKKDKRFTTDFKANPPEFES